MNPKPARLVVIETHPVQYHAPVYRAVQENHGIPVDILYGSDFSVAGYRDSEFGTSFAWDVDLVSGNHVRFLSQVEAGAGSFETVSSRGMAAALDAANPGAVLLTGYHPAFNRSAFYHAWRRRCPILFRAETTDHARRRSRMRQWIRDCALRRLYSLCRFVLPIGSNSYQHYTRLGIPESRLIFSRYCVDTTPFQCSEHDRERLRPAARRELNLNGNDIGLLFSGKLSVRKGVHVLVDAVRMLPHELRSCIVLMFLGAGREETNLRDACKAAPEVRAHFIGFRNQRELSPYYHAADTLVLPSVASETWGLVVNEALHHGLPCVVSDGVGCAADLIDPGETGEVAAAADASSLAAALQRQVTFVANPNVRHRCREKIRPYSVAAAAHGIASAYESAVRTADSLLLTSRP